MKTSDEIKAEMQKVFAESAPMRDALQLYSLRTYNLSIDYHVAKLEETFGLKTQNSALVAVLDIRNSPKSLDTTLDQLKLSGVKVTKAIRDVGTDKIYLFYES